LPNLKLLRNVNICIREKLKAQKVISEVRNSSEFVNQKNYYKLHINTANKRETIYIWKKIIIRPKKQDLSPK
jgi:hypothetical protein